MNRKAGWRNPKHRQQWENTLKTYAKPIWGKPVAEVDVAASGAVECTAGFILGRLMLNE